MTASTLVNKVINSGISIACGASTIIKSKCCFNMSIACPKSTFEKKVEGLLIFLAPPSLSELESRITNRGTESSELIRRRMQAAKEEIELMDLYDYVVENDHVTAATSRINAIVIAEHCRRERVSVRYKKMLEVE